nr:uncharacterized protein LOC123764906 [Procambarus clarkii]
MVACRLVEAVKQLGTVVHHRLYFSPTIHYLYASQLARHASLLSASGATVGSLEASMTAAQEEREDSLATRDGVIASLTSHLQHLDHAGAQAVLSCRQEAKTELEEVRANSEISLQELKGDLLASSEAMSTQEDRHHLQELVLRSRRQELERQVQGVIRRYDATMSRLQTSLDDLRLKHVDLTGLLQAKQESLETVEKRYMEILAEKQRIEEERMAAMQAEFRREHAARTIQRAWQHYKMRKMLKKAQKKKKKRPKDAKK